MERVELLSPAGDYECFKAALAAGADAVYLGRTQFSARAGAANFSADELKKAIDTAHILGRKVYLTVNILLRDDELDELYEMLYEPYMQGLDGIIVQDIGAIIQIRRMFPDLPVHVSTQAAVTGSEGALYLAGLGVKRIVPARELSLEEITRMRRRSGLEIECFIHGSLCYSYSGKCLMSSFIGGRSGNRGRCAQPCRLPYDGSYPLSLKDLCTVDFIPELIEAGISSFKIEGRMKNSTYVYGVTSIYRKYIDGYYNGTLSGTEPKDRQKLISYYTRGGNCSGYYKVRNSPDMITAGSPSYQTSNEEDVTDTDKDLSVGISIRCGIYKGQSVKISVFDKEHSVSVDTGIIPQTSINQSLTVQSVKKQLTKTGGTLFAVLDTDITVDEGLFLSNGSLNDIRRRGVGAFSNSILSACQRPSPLIRAGNDSRICTVSSGISGRKSYPPEVRVSVINKEQLAAAASSGADSLIMPMSLYISSEARPDKLSGKIYISLPYVVRDSGAISAFVRKYAVSGYYVSNFESLSILKDLSYKGEIIADIHMYAYNQEALFHYREQGILTTVPVELNAYELERRKITGEELIVYGKFPMMVSANCIYNTRNGCLKKPEGHGVYLTDRKHARFFVHCDCGECTNVIYNSVPLSISDEDRIFNKLSPASVRFMFTDESADTVTDVMNKYFAHRNENGSTDVKLTDIYTKGHIKRGVD